MFCHIIPLFFFTRYHEFIRLFLKGFKRLYAPTALKGLKKITENRRLRRVWQTHRTPDDKRKLNNATRNLTKIIKKFKNDCFQKYLVNLSPSADSNYSLWKASRKLTRPPPPNNPTNSLSARRMGTKPYRKSQPLRQLPIQHFQTTFLQYRSGHNKIPAFSLPNVSPH